MSLAEELEHLSSDNGNSKKINGWKASSSNELVPRKARLVNKDGRTMLKIIQLPERVRYVYNYSLTQSHSDKFCAPPHKQLDSPSEIRLNQSFNASFRNWFHLIIEHNWKTIILVFCSGFFLSWFAFAILYYAISRMYNPKGADNHEKCIANVDSFISAFLFSMESQHTIGYGLRYMTELCPPAYFALSLQCIAGVFLQTILAGIVIAKVLRPKKRRQEMRFSRMAVIGPLDEHDKRPTLMIRLADVQEKLYLAESHVRLYMACSRVNDKGERELVGVKDMNVGYDSGWDRVLLLWPIIVRHVIDESSPLYGMSRDTIQKQDFEMIMTVEGIVEATGMTFQARTSFLPDEILWGYKFRPMVLMNEKLSKYEVHYSLFDQTERILDFDSVTTEVEEIEEEHHHNASGFL